MAIGFPVAVYPSKALATDVDSLHAVKAGAEVRIASADQKINRTTEGVFWASGVDTPFIHRMRDRVFIGNAVGMGDSRSNTNTTWVPDATTGANWIPRDSQFISMSDNGSMALSGGSRASDGAGLSTATIGVAGFVINDGAGPASWAFYADVQHEPSATANSYGIEVAAKNKTTNDTASTPYNLSYGVFGVWLAGGSDASYGGAPTHPANAGIMLLKSANALSSGWNVGINFDDESLTYTGGVARAISMANGHAIEWWAPDGLLGAQIYSTVDLGTGKVQQIFDDNTITWYGTTASSAKPILRISHASSGVNYIQITNAATANLPSIIPVGDDTNIGLYLQPKGTGSLFFASGDGTAKMRMNNTGISFFTTSPVAQKSGWTPATGTATRATFDTATVTLSVLAEHVKALIDDLHATAGYGLLKT